MPLIPTGIIVSVIHSIAPQTAANITAWIAALRREDPSIAQKLDAIESKLDVLIARPSNSPEFLAALSGIAAGLEDLGKPAGAPG